MVQRDVQDRWGAHCPDCGNLASPGARFCGHCGCSLTGGQPAGAVVRHPPDEQPGWRLHAISGPDSGTRFALGGLTRLGRSPENDIHLTEPQASRRHALVEKVQDDYLLSDLGSRNGTYVNDQRIDRATRLRVGDTIRVGGTTLRVEAEGPVAASGAAPSNVRPEPVAASPPPVQPAASGRRLDSEKVLGVIPGVELRRGLLGSETFNLVVTEQRLVFAPVTSDMLREAADRARAEARNQGRGLFGQWGAVLGSNRRIVDQYFQMPVEEILQRQPGGFFIPVHQVKRVRFRTNPDPERAAPDEMTIHAEEKLRFNLRQTTAGEAKKTLRQLLGGVVK